MKQRNIILFVAAIATGGLLAQSPPAPGTSIPDALSISLTESSSASIPLSLAPTGFNLDNQVAVIVYHASW